jgi:protein SCO1/2
MADRRALRFLSLLLLAGAPYLSLESMAIDGDGAPSDTSVGVDEHLGGVIPADIAFYDEHGARRTMGELVDRPTILALVFYHCPGICGMIQGNLGGALKDVKRAAGGDYRILSASFDDEETPDLAAEAASNYTGIAGMALPEGAWRFTTGDAADIKRICDAVGFRYVKNGTHDYTHPALVTVLSKDRKIIRYLYGTQYLPLDIEMALSEAERNQPGVSIRRMISYCYSYDPKSGRYVFGLFRVAGATTITVMGILLFFLLRRRPERGQGGGTP